MIQPRTVVQLHTMRLFTLASAALLAAIPLRADAVEAFLCIPEAAALVENNGDDGIQAGVADVQDQKFLQVKHAGKWVLKEHGTDRVMFDDCPTIYLCQSSKGYGGAFLRNNRNNVFSITWMRLVDGRRERLLVAKGKCTQI